MALLACIMGRINIRSMSLIEDESNGHPPLNELPDIISDNLHFFIVVMRIL